MLKSHLKTAWRNIIGHKGNAFINVLGLALGISVCIVIYLVTSYKLSFDTFHPDKQRIYRILGDITENNGDKTHFASVPNPLALTARQELSGLDAIGGIIPYRAAISIPGQSPRRFDNPTPG